MQSFQLFCRIECAKFGGESDVDHARAHHVIGSLVGEKGLKPRAQLPNVELTLMRRQGDDLVSGKLHGTGLMNVDVSRLCTQHALVGL